MKLEKSITVPELARILGVSRVTVYRWVRSGQIPATKIGKTYVITDQVVTEILGKKASQKGKAKIEEAVDKTVKEYGEVLAKLSKE